MVYRKVLSSYKGICAECMFAVLDWAVMRVDCNLCGPDFQGLRGMWFQLNENFSTCWEGSYSCFCRVYGRGVNNALGSA